MSLHNRDLGPAPDDFDLDFAVLDGAIAPANLAQVQSDYIAAHAEDAVVA